MINICEVCKKEKPTFSDGGWVVNAITGRGFCPKHKPKTDLRYRGRWYGIYDVLNEGEE